MTMDAEEISGTRGVYLLCNLYDAVVWAGFLGPFDVRHAMMGRMARKVLS